MMTTAQAPCEATGSSVKPLTASSKRLMELELKLLEQLEDSDDVIDPLVELWTAERQDAAKELQEMELGGCSPGLVREEEQLRAMIQRYGMEWVEPMSRLAVLLFTKGRLSEAMDLVQKVLEIKPWHFEAGQLLVIMLLREGDYNNALRAARSYMLPNFNDHTDSRRRKRWVRDKVNQARGLFRQALEATTTAVHGDVTEGCPVDEPYCWQ
jgi:tetratricopeptide (TPR) repeat protein